VNIAENIKNTAKRKSIVLKNMLSDCELNSNTLSTLYHGKMIGADRLAKIADYLGVTVDYLLNGTEPLPKELTPDEAELLELYRKLDTTERLEHRAELKGYVRAKEKK
jgi:transcriptional regulator with XRE-family HTH domain